MPQATRGASTPGLAISVGTLIAALVVADAWPVSAQVAEVVVTARKRDENIQNIPVAVTAISGADVEKFNLTSVEDVANKTPQLIITRGSSGSGADITLRGIGASSENIGIEQSVSVNVDGVYYGQGRAIDEGVFDVSSVQVLKGPQALFYGKNATAGALAIQTNDPGKQAQGSITAGYEFNAEEPYVEGILSGPVTDTFGLRLAFHYSDQQNGYLRNTAFQTTYHTFDVATGNLNSYPTGTPPNFLGGAQDALVRLTAKWQPTSRLTVTGKFTFDDHSTNNNSDNTVPVYCPLGYPQSEAGLPNPNPCVRKFAAAQPALPIALAAVPGSLEGAGGGADFEHYRDYNGYLRVNYEADWITLTSTNGYQKLSNAWADNQNFTAAPSVYAGEHFSWEQFSSEERFNTKFKGPINFAGGVYFQTTSLDFRQNVDFAAAQNTAAPTPQDEFVAYSKFSRTTGHTYAVFGQGIWDIIPRVELTAGARYTHELKDSFFLQPYVNPTLNFLFVQYDPANPATVITGKQTFDNVSPEVTLTWKATDQVTLYGAYKTGYKSGGFSNSAILSTGTLPGDLRFRPETATGGEIGIKTTLFDRQLRFDADGFYFDYSNLQVDFFNTPTFNYVTLNAASARTYGVEATVDYAPRAMPGLVVHADGAYNNSSYGQFTAPCSPAGITYEQGCNLLRVVAPNGSYSFSPGCGDGGVVANCNFMNVNGRPTALAPKWTGLIGVDYQRPVSSTLKVDLAADVRASSGYIANPFPSGVALQVDHQNAYAVLDAALSLSSADNRWTLSLIGKNLTNEFIELGTAGLPLSGGTTGCKTAVCGPQLISDQAAVVANPRTVAIQLKYGF